MHPLIITPLYPPAVGGAATYFGDVVPCLAQRDEIDRLTVLTERLPGQPAEVLTGSVRLLRWLPRRVSGPRRRWMGHACTYVLTQLWFATLLSGFVKRDGVDLLHFHTRYRGRLFYDVLRRLDLAVIADLRDKMSDPGVLANVADLLLCCGEGVRRFATTGGFPAQRTALIPIPFKPPEVPAPDQVASVRERYALGEAPFVLFLGDITYNKGVYDLLAAYQRWQMRYSDVHLIYAGSNREGERFERLVEGAAGARYLGRVPHQDALALMRGAEIVTLPSRSEGLPRVILEAVAMGAKVMCPPGIPEFEQHLPEFVLSTVSEDAIVHALDRIWHSARAPSYPIHRHDIHAVVEALTRAYGVAER